MGEAGRKNRKRAAVAAAEQRCIYCADPSETAEHMPPRLMFRGKHRREGWNLARAKSAITERAVPT
jgi:hypothetical protein